MCNINQAKENLKSGIKTCNPWVVGRSMDSQLQRCKLKSHSDSIQYNVILDLQSPLHKNITQHKLTTYTYTMTCFLVYVSYCRHRSADVCTCHSARTNLSNILDTYIYVPVTYIRKYILSYSSISGTGVHTYPQSHSSHLGTSAHPHLQSVQQTKSVPMWCLPQTGTLDSQDLVVQRV